MVSLTPRYWRSAPASAIHAAPASMPREGHGQLDADGRRADQQVADHRRGQAAEHERAFGPDDHEPGLGGERDAERGQDERGRPGQGVLPGEGAGKAARDR